MEPQKLRQYLDALSVPGLENAPIGKSAFEACEVHAVSQEDSEKIVKTCCRACILYDDVWRCGSQHRGF